RRRHTRFSRDWSSDVCSSDLWEIPGGKRDSQESPEVAAAREVCEETGLRCHDLAPLLAIHPCGLDTVHNPSHAFYTRRFERVPEIGRASCRERRQCSVAELSF